MGLLATLLVVVPLEGQAVDWPFEEATPPDRGASVETIVAGLYETAAADAAGIEEYWVVEDVTAEALGQFAPILEVTTQYVKDFIDDHPVFRAAGTWVEREPSEQEPEVDRFEHVAEYGPALLEHGRYVGVVLRSNAWQHIIQVDDPDVFSVLPPGASTTYVPGTLWVRVDRQRKRLSGVDVAGEARVASGLVPVHMRRDFTSWEEYGGLVLPRDERVHIRRAAALMDEELRAQRDQITRDGVEGASEWEVDMLLDHYRRVLRGERGASDMTTTRWIREVDVIEGAPGDPTPFATPTSAAPFGERHD